MHPHSCSVAVIGAGIAGSTIARALAAAGHPVHVFDKSVGPGGRMASRRVDWVDRQGRAVTTRLDHGGVGFTVSSAAFQASVDLAQQTGCLAEWRPRLDLGGESPGGRARLYVPVPDMPALARHLMDGMPATWSFAVDGLFNGSAGWLVHSGEAVHPSAFSAVVLALPPAQAAPLLAAHRLDWARRASVAPMQPCWTLMGIAADSTCGPGWDLARPASGPLAWVQRNDSRPGRAAAPGEAHWVAHARKGWSRRHLEQPAGWVEQEMKKALVEYLGTSVEWYHCTVHRWRYALPQAHSIAPAASFWWDAALGLGVCGDFLGGCGVEGAWMSAQALSAVVLQSASDALARATACSAPEASLAAPGCLSAPALLACGPLVQAPARDPK